MKSTAGEFCASRATNKDMGEKMAKQGRKPLYDWEKLLDGNVHKLKAGESFKCGVKSMRTGIYNMADIKGIKISTMVDGEFLYIIPHEKLMKFLAE